MLNIVDIIYKGFIIGIIVSAPTIGPIGMLCVQRTLSKGQWHGFFTGVGAALSDVFYAGIISLGMGFIIDFITGYQYILQITGSALLIAFGVYIFLSNPFKRLHEPGADVNESYLQDTVTTFFLTLSNPAIFFFYIVLFARFNFIAPEEKLFSILLGLTSIFGGALSWWFLITFLVGKLRKKINFHVLLIINRIVGAVIIALSIYYIIALTVMNQSLVIN